MYLQSDNKMPLITDEGKNVLICFDEKEVIIDDIVKYEYESVRVEKPYTYSKIVSALVNDHYTNDDMQAIINNHLAGYDDHEPEYQRMQEWRIKAKAIATEICNN